MATAAPENVTQLVAQLSTADLIFGHQYKACDILTAELAKMGDRVQELLQANNDYLERARKAERELAVARNVAKMAIIVAGEMAKQLPEVQL